MPRQARNFYQNYLVNSNDLSSASWTKQVGVTVTPNQIANPIDGAVDADLVDVSAAIVGRGVLQGVALNSLVANRVNTKVVWLRGFDGGEQLQLVDPQLSLGITTCNLTLNWQKFTLSESGQIGSFGLWVRKISGNKFYQYNGGLTVANWGGHNLVTGGSSVTTAIPNVVSGRTAASGRSSSTGRSLIT